MRDVSFFRLSRATLLIAITGCLTACSALKNKPLVTHDKYCEPTVGYDYGPAYLPHPDMQAILQKDTAFAKRYSEHDLLIANGMGILPLLEALNRLERHATPTDQLEIVSKRQQILNRLMLASIQISSVAAELDCEGERADRLATYLDQRDTRRIRRLTLLSVVVGAVTTVATALVQATGTNKAVGIGGGVVSAAFGSLAAFSSDRTIELIHQRNLLTDIWTQNKQSSVYPPFVWYVLNEKLFSNDGQHAVSYNIRHRWQDYVLNGTADEEKLYFGKGGNYQADDLHARANMLNQLQSSVRSINQDLQSLVLSLAK